MEHLEFLEYQDPILEKRMKKNEKKLQQTIKALAKNFSSSVITIPVVVHVVYNNSSENISDAQVLSQINILNEDFRRNNSDASNTPSAFQSLAADSEIEFCLATIDPNGNITSGITRTSTSQSSFSSNNDMKYSSSGGIDAWNSSDYLNIWVCDLGSSLLGYAQFPGGPISSDGVVCHYNYFGDIGTASYPYELGRTATHEVGHYLNLRHIWGDSNCGNDYCSDTPTQQGSNGGCPNFPSTSNCTGNGSNGDMFMNYMDYTYDACMNMFTQDQKTRMITAINQYRSGLLSSNGCQGVGYGCTDPSAYNYDLSATIDDGSCCVVAGCTDLSASNYNSNACYDNGSCTYLVYGCTDPIAANFNPLATIDDGSCCYGDQLVITITTDNYPVETSWQLVNQSGTVVQSISAGDLTQANTSYTWSICPSSTDCYNFIIYDTYGDGICCNWGNGSYSVSYNGTVVASGGSFASSETTSSIGSCITSVVGCMNPNASNYDPLANTSIAFGGILDPNIGAGAYFNANQYLIFNASFASKIVSAVVYAQTSNTITFELRDNSSNVIDDTTITVVTGGQRLYFDFDVPVGNNYELGIVGTNSGLYRNNGGVSYPYDIGGLLNITASSAGTGGYYYFYYDIEVEAVCTGITSTVYGCTGPSYCNYDATATIDDGSCAGLAGCMDPLYTEYNSIANCDDGSCVTLIVNTTCGASLITGLGVTNVIHDRVTLTFDDMNTYDALGAQICRVDQLRIRYREVGTSTWSQKNMAAPTGYDATTGICNSTQNTDKLVLGLIGSTTYEWEMRVWYCTTGSTAWVVGPGFTTADNCPNVGNLVVTSGSTTQATFTWDASNGAYSFVRIKIRPDNTGGAWVNVGGFGTSYPLVTKNKNGLTPGQSYRGQARTWCNPTGGAYKSPTWTSLVYWTQPTSVRLEGGTAINNLAIYPNPSRDIFNITFTSEQVQDLNIRVLNLIGEEIISDNLEQFIGEYTKQINLSDKAKGIYFLEIETNEEVINNKLILQ